MFDYLIKGGTVVDGSGRPGFVADVAVQRHRIAAIGQLEPAQATHVIDASGKIVTPGIIDIHTHSDRSIFTIPQAQSSLRQGVTTEVMANCGLGLAPVTNLNRSYVQDTQRTFFPQQDVSWASFAEYVETIAACRPSINLVPLIGRNCVRSAVIGMVERAATPDEVKAMQEHVREGLEAGAFGLSTGLEFQPGRGCTRQELDELCRLVAQYSGLHASHIRNRDRHIERATEEILEVSRQSAVSLQISHFDAKPGHPTGAWERSVAMMERAREQGIDVTTDCQNYHGGPGLMSGILPPWLMEQGADKAVQLMRDPQVRAKLRTQCDRYWLMPHLGQWDRVWLGPTQHSRQYTGITFDRIAKMMGKDPWDAFFDILTAEGPSFTSAGWDGIYYTDEHLDQQALHPLYMFESDAWTAAEDGPLADMVTYPNHFGWVIRFLIRYSRDRKLLPLEQTIRKMTSMPAHKLGLKDRGQLAEGKAADIAVYDLEKLEERATYEEPRRYPKGVEWVFVNGVPTVEQGEHTGARAGRVLRRGEGAP